MTIMQFIFFSSCTAYYLIYFFLVLVSLLHLGSAQTKVKLPEKMEIPAVFAFGDSIADTGNNNYRVTTSTCNFPPYGRDLTLMGGKPTGRFSNGKLPPDLIEQLGIKELLPPYLDPNLQTKDLITGVNFASAGAGYYNLSSQMLDALDLSGQLQLLKEYIGKIKERVGEERTNSIMSNSFFLITAGANDVANSFFFFQDRKLEYNISVYTDIVATSASIFFEELYGLGARRIGVASLPPIGCLPIQITLGGGIIERRCVDAMNQAAKLFNQKLLKVIDALNRKLPQATLVYLDSYNIMNDIIQNPQKYGFDVSNRGCCGTGLFEVGSFCNQWSPFTCSNATEFVFWDGYHPTEKTYRILFNYHVPYWINHTYNHV